MGDHDNEEASPPKKAKKFSCQEFRKELKGSEALKSLKKFVSAAKNSEDVVYEYLECGGSAHEILSLVDDTASGDLTTALPVFEAIHLILLRFQSPDSNYHQECVEVAKLILNSHILTVKSMLSMNITKQKKVALKLLTAIVTMHFSFASEVLNLIQLSPAVISDFIIPSPEKESLRKCFILFTLSFLIESNLVTLKSFLDKKGFLNSIIPGLKFDDSNTVNLVLSLFEDKILKNSKINKSLKLKIFNTQIIKALFDLYDWKGPQGVKQLHTLKKTKIKEVEVNQKEKEMVVECVHSFLLLLCCSKKFGIAFVDKSMGTSEQLSNQLLLTVFESLPDPLKNNKIAEIILKSIANCPDIMKPVLGKLEPFFQPRNSKNWFDAMKFAENLVKEMNVSTLIKNESEIPSTGQIIKIAKALCIPIVFLRAGKSGMEKSHSMEIRLCSLRLLTTMWNEIQSVTTAFPQCEKDLKKSIQYLILKFYPDISDLVELWGNLCDTEYLNRSLVPLPKRYAYLSIVLISLRIVVEYQKESVTSLHSLISGMVKNIEQIQEATKENECHDLQVKIVQFVEVDVESLTPDTELFEKSLLILLRYTDNISHASKILSKINVFKEHEEEVDVWMLSFSSLSQDYCSAVAKSLVKAFQQLHSKNKRSLQTNEYQMDVDIEPSSRKSLSPLLLECIEVLKDLSSNSKTNNQQFKAFQYYLNNTVIHLQHFCTNHIFIFDVVKTEKKLLNKGVINYLKRWKSNSMDAESSDVFTDPLEQEVIKWLLDERNDKKFQDIIEPEKNCLKLYGIFNIVSGYLTNKVANDSLESSDSTKYSEALLCFTNTQDLLVDTKNIISSDLKNLPNFYGNCVNSLFRNEILLNSFNIFEKKNENCKSCTEIIVKVLMESSEIKNYLNKNKLAQSWKSKFLEQIMAKLKKNKFIDSVKYLVNVLDIFDYDSSEIETLIELLISVSDLNLFIKDKKPSMWSVVLINFVKLSCSKTPLSSKVVKKLCNIMKFTCQENCTSLELWDECFIYLLRKHPVHLLAMDNDFFDVLLTRNSSTPDTVIFGKLLLNDPKKVNHFIEKLSDNLDLIENPDLIFSSLNGLIMRNDSFLEAINSKESCVVWRISDIKNNTSSPLFKILSFAYKKFKKQIFRTSGDESSYVCKNLDFLREVVNLFVDEKDTKFIKETINKGIHQPELIFEAVKKINLNDITEFYLQSLLSTVCQTIKNFKENNEDTIWPRYCAILSDVIALESDISWKNILQSSHWKEFVKLSIGHCFSTTKHPELLKILRVVITSVPQGSSEDKILSLIFQMVISHSQFLSIILGKSPLKTELVELFYVLVRKIPSEMSQKHTPVLLASYNASLSPCDQSLLKILKLYESSGVTLSDYEPFVWADSAVSHYSVGSKGRLSLWQRFNMVNVLDLLDSNRIEYSLTHFPIYRSLEIDQNYSPIDDKTYDPAFLLPLFVNLLSPGSLVFCLPFVYKGALGYTIRALSSECSDVRLIASVVLSRFYNHLELAQNLKQKLVWMHFINCFRFGIDDLTSFCLPNITTLFFARMTLELSKPPAEMHIPLQKFLLAKSYFVFNSVPEFLPLFQSSEVAHWKHREWLLRVLRDGTKTTLDLNIIFHSMAPKVIFCYFHSPLCDNETKKLILQVMESCIKVEKSILLISEYSLLNWIQSTNTNCLPIILLDLVKLLSVTTDVIIKDINNPKSNHTNSSHLVQIVNFLIKLTPDIKSAKSKEIFQIYIKIILNCLMVFFKEKRLDWFKINKNVLENIIDAGISILGENYNSEKFCKVSFYVKDSDEIYDSEVGLDLKNLVYLFCSLTNSIESVNNKEA